MTKQLYHSIVHLENIFILFSTCQKAVKHFSTRFPFDPAKQSVA